MVDIVTEEVTSPLGEDWSKMTFPMYRHLLPLLGTNGADAGGVRPVARAARVGARPVALALAQLPTSEQPSAELLSIYVVADLRGHGVATELLAGLETDLAVRGVSRVTGGYMTGKPTIQALERVFAKRGFDPPVLRTVVVRCTPEELSRTVWYQKAKLTSGSSIFPWTELTPKEREELHRSQVERRWIHPDLEPWRFDKRFDELSSVGMRRSGEVVGWVINHRIAPDMVRFTISFVRDDLARRGAIFALYVGSISRLLGTGATCTFVTASYFESMNRFTLRRIAPFVSFCGETRGVSKALLGAAVSGETRT